MYTGPFLDVNTTEIDTALRTPLPQRHYNIIHNTLSHIIYNVLYTII